MITKEIQRQTDMPPTSPQDYARLIEETIVGTRIAVREGRMQPDEAQRLVNEAMFKINISQLLGMPVETESHQTKELEEKLSLLEQGVPEEET